ncbi:uncharacterized protein LOC133791305 [Humulus lupulus]|uniref:uncharacterized protein LOC133791305 n=1 Tax=Humulus lupulus TaxID=3486 RepID=UPI002B406516|nr:uncharacterized protein LOC133791305 [Humulus lupulus]
MSSNSSIVSNTVPQFIDSQQTTPPDLQVNSTRNPQNAEEETNISNNVIFHKNKIFVGGLPHQIEEIELKSYFSTYGKVMHTKIMRDVLSGRGRGFGFITFHEEEVVENVLKTTFHNLKNKRVEVKRAVVEQTRVAQPKTYTNSNYSTFNNDSSSNNNYYNTFNNNNNITTDPNVEKMMTKKTPAPMEVSVLPEPIHLEKDPMATLPQYKAGTFNNINPNVGQPSSTRKRKV